MGIKIKVSEISRLIIYYILIINACCDISLVSCDIHEMRQKHIEGLAEANFESKSIDFKINATELEEHIMTGLNMTTKPDIELANISQEEFLTKYNEYLSKLNYRKRRSAKFYGDYVTNFVYGDGSESVKKIFTFKHSNKLNRVRNQRSRRSTNDEEITTLDFEINNRDDLPLDIEESILNVFLTNDSNHVPEKSWKADKTVHDSDSDSEYDENNSFDESPKKLVLKSHRNRNRKSHMRHHSNSHNNRNKVQIITNKQMIRLHVYHSSSEGRMLLFSKDIILPINSDVTQFTYKKWIQLDLTTTVNRWLQEKEKILGIDVYCESCSKYGLKIVNQHDEMSKNNPALNIVGSVVRTKRKTGHKKHGHLDEAKDYTITQPRKTFCRQDGDKKCCRHKWVIDFKELGGYDYIIQPRNFDAGFCDGTCPYKYNVANNHAFFQSLARHQLKNSKVPNVCCAPTRLLDMEVLHIDEADHTRLKVTTMKKMRVMKCSCT